MYIVASVLIIIASILMILVVLVQNSKGGGLAANFQSTGQVMGVRKTADFLEKATWALAIGMVFFSLIIIFFYQSGGETVQRSSRIERTVNTIPGPVNPDEAPVGE